MRPYFILLMLFLSQAWAEPHHPQDFLKSIAGKPEEGQLIVDHFCGSCHAPNPVIQLGAPRIGNEKDWQPRLKQGIKELLQSLDIGKNAMPPRGGCFECSDKQLMLAFQTMLPRDLQKSLLNYLTDHNKINKIKK